MIFISIQVPPFGVGSMEPYDVSAITLWIHSVSGHCFSVFDFIDFSVYFPLLFGASIFAWALITDSGHYWDYFLWASFYSFGYADDMRRFYLFYTLVLISLWRFLLFIDD